MNIFWTACSRIPGRTIGWFFVLTFGLVSGSVPSASASDQEEPSAEVPPPLVTLPAGTVVKGDYFAVGDTVEISGTVHGDVYVAGGQVLVDGIIHGDLLAACGTLTLSGTVTQDIRAVGGQITVSGDIGRNVTLAGGTLLFTPSATIQGSLVASGGLLRLAAPVRGAVTVAAGSATLSGRIDGRVEAMAGTLRLTSNARLADRLTYRTPEPASIDEHATIAGPITRKRMPRALLPETEDVFELLVGLWLLANAASLVTTLVLGLLLLHFSPKLTHVAMSHLSERPLETFGLGLLGLIGAPLLAALLALTVLGLPLAAFVVVLYLLSLYLGRLFVLGWAGLQVLTWIGKPDSRRTAFVVGAVAYFLLSLIPFLGGLLTFFTLLAGLGTLLLTFQAVYTAARQEGLI